MHGEGSVIILATGATGFTGSLIIKQLRSRFPDSRIRCFVRPTSDVSELESFQVEIVKGDLQEEEHVRRAIEGARVVIHVANIRFSPTVVGTAIAAGVEQVVLVHTTGMFSRYRAYAEEYLHIEREAIAKLEGSSCRYTIIRPTMIYGGWRDHNFHKLIKLLRRTPVFPIFGNGSAKMQPVHARDLADSIVDAVDNPRAFDRAFNVSGGSVHSYKEILRMVAGLLGRRVWLISVPMGLALAGIWLLNLVKRSPVSIEQVRRLLEDKVFDHSLATDLLGYHPRDLVAGLRQQIEEMGYR